MLTQRWAIVKTRPLGFLPTLTLVIKKVMERMSSELTRCMNENFDF